MKYTTLVALVALLLVSRGISAEDLTPETEGRVPIGAFAVGDRSYMLPDVHGKQHALGDYDEAKLLVVAFLGNECPLAKLYARRLEALAADYRDKSVVVIGVNANRQDTLSEMAAFARKLEVTYPLLKDRDQQVADALGAERTPQVFLLDEQRRVRYSGAVDDQYGIGYQRDEPNEAYLVDAIEQLLADKSVERPRTDAVGCRIGRVERSASNGEVTYNKHIAPIVNQHCVECHRAGEIGPFPLETYDDAVGWEEMILEVVAENRMPPWYANPAHGEFKNDARLTSEEKRLLRAWVAGGSPEGDPADLPEPPQFAEGWRIAEPDQIVAMDDASYHVPAEGVVDYQYYLVDPEWKEDRYIVAAEARPGNREVVHHIIAYLIPPGAKPTRAHPRSMLVGYAPGTPPNVLTDGKAVHVAAGSRLLFELHYTPNGVAQDDLSRVGFKFAPKEQVTQLVHGRAAINARFAIPPHAANHKVVAHYTSKQDELLLRMNPHMHLRGKSFRYEAIYPDGAKEILLDVPAYDFNWQLSYELAEPKRLPRGTQIICTAHYDNSAANPANPDPTKEIRWGEQSWDEMMIGFFDVIEVE